jgi:hypothetical protein
MTDQREFFSRGKTLKIARSTWTNKVLEKTIVKVIRDGLNACRIPNYRVRERICICPRCHQFIGQPSEEGIADLVGWIPAFLWPGEGRSVPLFIEVKRPKGGIEGEAQKQFLERAKRDGGIAMIARGWDEVADQLRGAGVKLPEGI